MNFCRSKSSYLRILHTESSGGWGGQEIRILTEASGMIARGHQVSILACPDSNILKEARKLGIPTIELPIFKKKLSYLWAMRQFLKKNAQEFDVINTHSSTDAWLVALAGLFVKETTPVVRTRHISAPINQNLFTRWLYLRATNYIVITGEKLRQILHAENKYPLDHIVSIPTGIDLLRYHPGNCTTQRAKLGLPERPTLGIVATLRSWKGHSDLLLVWVKLQRRFVDWQLVICGDGPQREKLEKQTVELGIADTVHFIGNCEDIEEWFQAFNLFTLPSYANEGVPQVLMQAMASRLPVVSTSVGAIAEAVLDTKTGYLVAPRQLDKLEDRLACLMSDSSLREKMGDAGYEYALKHFSCELMLDAMTIAFKNVLKRRV